jgi:hypothetical protein
MPPPTRTGQAERRSGDMVHPLNGFHHGFVGIPHNNRFVYGYLAEKSDYFVAMVATKTLFD